VPPEHQDLVLAIEHDREDDGLKPYDMVFEPLTLGRLDIDEGEANHGFEYTSRSPKTFVRSASG
jgi:hypothetical protein